MSAKRISGTKEWSVKSENIVAGCPHRCRYCYARAMALRYRRIKCPEEWGTTFLHLRTSQVHKTRRRVDGTIMFPSTHDITPEHLDACLEAIGRILRPGNRLLIVSKPHIDCIRAICERFVGYRESILFRFTIGASDDRILAYWEPGAPTFAERKASLMHAHAHGFATSVSAEPLLDANVAHVVDLVRSLQRHVTDSIWIGKLNGIDSRIIPGTSTEEISRIKAGQTAEAVRAVYSALRGHPLVKWKESYKEILGLDFADRAGLDV